MTAPPPGAQISEDGFYWWNENTGDPNEPARWELLDNSAAQATSSSQADPAANSSTPEQNSSQQQSDAGDVTLSWEYTADDEMSLALDDLVASGWEPGDEDEMA